MLSIKNILKKINIKLKTKMSENQVNLSVIRIGLLGEINNKINIK